MIIDRAYQSRHNRKTRKYYAYGMNDQHEVNPIFKIIYIFKNILEFYRNYDDCMNLNHAFTEHSLPSKGHGETFKSNRYKVYHQYSSLRVYDL